MGDIANRLGRLEGRTPPTPRARPGSVTLAEIRRLEACIKQMEAGEVRPAPEADVAERLEPAAEVAAVLRELDRLERLDHGPERGTRWT